MGNELIYVDDSGFDKIADRRRAVLVCAGDAKLIELWKDWFTQPSPSNELPPTDRIELDGSFHDLCVTIVLKPTFEIFFSNGNYEKHEEDAWFTGTGGSYAKDCYAVNGCSIKCVQTASSFDPKTGGETKYVNFSDGASNLHGPSVSYKELEELFKQRGIVMNLTTKETRPINGSTASELAHALTSEKVSISAPTGRPPRAWTMEEKIDVSTAMRRIVELEASED